MKSMKAVSAMGTGALIFAMMTGCGDSSMIPVRDLAKNKTALVGAWSCLTQSRIGAISFTDDKTYSADGWHTSSKFPEEKKYAYRVDGQKLIVSFRAGDATATVVRLTNDALEYYSGKPGQMITVTCRKKS